MSTPPLSPSNLVRIEARALDALATRLDAAMAAPFDHALELALAALASNHRLVLIGIGKSGLIARKIAATLRSTGTPAHFLHAAEAVHGDLGLLAPGDLVLALSYSGETEELLRLLPVLKRRGHILITLCGCPASTLAEASDLVLDTSVDIEACPLNLAPTASTTVMLALGDALALELSRRRNFQPEDFADLHPGGRLGRRLTRVRDLMHTGEAIPAVAPTAPLPEVIHEMSRKKLGLTTVLSSHASTPRTLLGIISDGDLRRLLERDGANALTRTAAEIMNPHPLTISPTALASSALALMEEKKITALIVTTVANHVDGVLHLHDLWTLDLS